MASTINFKYHLHFLSVHGGVVSSVFARIYIAYI